jgi:PAS domain S-box-containing protein
LSEVFETSDRLEAVFGSMPEGFAVFDDSLRCVYLNDAMAMMDGRPKAQLMGEVLAPQQREGASLLSLFEEARKAGAEVRRELRHPIRDDWAEVSAIPFTGGFALFSRDMTERKRADGE